jgi:hypothetical protein
MPIRWAYLKRVLAGAIFGLYIANLLYFLNPQIDITPGRLATVTIVYGLICGLLFGSVLWLLRALRVRLFGKPETHGGFRPHGFGFVVLAAFLAAALYWMHLEVFRIYLPVGAIRVLSKATNLITATAFVLLLIWFAERNADRRTSRILFVAGVILIAISSFFLYQRRDSYRTEVHAVVADIGTVAGKRPVIVVAIRNLPYDWILTMAGEGSLPFFDEARTRGYFTRLEPFPTMSPKSIWASVATGKLPFRHGVTGRLGYATPLNRAGERFLIIPGGVGFKAWGLIPPVTRISTPLPSGLSLPLWTLFERLGVHATVIGWPWSQPAGAARIVTDRYFDNAPRKTSDVNPPQFAAEIAKFETAPPDSETQRFNGTGAAKQRIVSGLSADLTSMAILRASAPSFPLTVCTLGGFEQTQRAIHIFTDELPQRSTVKGVVLRAYAEQLDRMLASLARDYPNHVIVVVSPSGPVPPQLPATPYALLRDFVDPADPSADDGFVLIHGAGVVHSEKPRSALAVDVVPTVLYIAGLPVGRDMDGSVLSEAFAEELLRSNPLSLVQTYEAQQLVVRRSGGG